MAPEQEHGFWIVKLKAYSKMEMPSANVFEAGFWRELCKNISKKEERTLSG